MEFGSAVVEVSYLSELSLLKAAGRSRDNVPPPMVGRPIMPAVYSEAERNWPFLVGFATTV